MLYLLLVARVCSQSLRYAWLPLRLMNNSHFAAVGLLLFLSCGCAAVHTPAMQNAHSAGDSANSAPASSPSDTLAFAPPLADVGAPLVLYTDLVSGPNSGGEDNDGAYLSIFGKNFGRSGLGSTVKVYVGGAEVARYLYLGSSKGRATIEQITVQVGNLGSPSLGASLPIRVVVNGVASNADQTFIVNPGRILYVDNVTGNDFTAVIGDIRRPFRHVQTANPYDGAWGRARPGDIIVMRGTGGPWTDVGLDKYFMRYRNKSGSAPTGRPGTGAIVLMSYPGEDVYVRGTLSAGMTAGCISAVNGRSFPGLGQWAVIAGLRIDCEGYDGPINQEIAGNHWRVINNDLSASSAPTSGPNMPRMGGITGNGSASIWLGNHIHDIQGSSGECHGIYIDGDGSYEIAYNVIENIRSGNGLQTYADGSNGSAIIDNVHFHHNLIHDVSKHALNIADGSRNGFVLYDNVIYDVSFAGVRFNTTTLSGALFYNNTFYNTNTNSNALYGVLTNDWELSAHAVALVNNILEPAQGMRYLSGTVGFQTFPGTATNNLFYAGMGPVLGSAGLSTDPAFVDVTARDFHLTRESVAINAGSTAVASVVTTDYDLHPREAGRVDIGALAYPTTSGATPSPPH